MLANRPTHWSGIMRQRRLDLGLTQSQVSAELGMSRQWVARFENGHAAVATLESVLALADVLELDIALDERRG
jgi:transcriptional regulator with XRE-family HTH domain